MIEIAPPVPVRVGVHLRDDGDHTVSELARALSISRTATETSLLTLMDAGLVAEVPNRATRGAGRPARRYTFDTPGRAVAGVDIGAHSVRVVVADLAGFVVAQRTFPGLLPDDDAAIQLDHVETSIRRALSDARIDPNGLEAVGVALPAIVDSAGRVLASVVLPLWSGIDVVGHLQEALGCPVAIDNGVRLAAVAEHHLGAARLIDEVLYLSVGNRVAAGLILGGTPRRGVHNVAGDVGRLAFRGWDATTGQIQWRAAPTAEEVFALAEKGSTAAQAEIDQFIDELGRGIATLVMAVDPAIVVIGGGISLAKERLLYPLRRMVSDRIALPLDIPIVAARLGANAAAHGALVFAFHRAAVEIYRVPGMPPPPITPLGDVRPERETRTA
ncbi:ROK family transcriptional regulator [Microbacterium sp. ABRD28]|uniref:ROK family transcriptional regulator n=1 Tax=Microbacterium sp. ABRD28 TaxID=2268461 RepID=UPI000F554A8A|nr:ROK family transcriptional regulator [Microbacterium sp. ABRD28]AZC14007.1 ROK family transcriptional regulator [Microbacterium sp. ABRD28]